MKAKNILMTLLLVAGAIAAKASGYPAELALVSQPVMVYNPNSITVYYDVENIGDYTYRGNVYIYLDPDYGYYYAEKYVKVRPGRIKRIEVEIPCHSIDRHVVYTMMPYYEVGRDLYSFTTFEYFEPVRFCWHGPRTEPWVVINIGPCPSYYHRPGTYRYYYDGFRPPMPPPGHGHGHTPPPMDPMHHTYNYHHSNGGYPANHFNGGTPPPAPNNNGNNEAPNATVRPKPNAGSMSSGSGNNPPAPNNGGSSARPKTNNGSSSGSNNSGRVNSGSSSHGSNGNSGRVSNSNSNTRPNGTGSSSSGRTGNNNSNSRAKSSSSSSRPAGTSSSASSSRSGSSSTRSSSSSSGSSSSRSGSGSGRR